MFKVCISAISTVPIEPQDIAKNKISFFFKKMYAAAKPSTVSAKASTSKNCALRALLFEAIF